MLRSIQTAYLFIHLVCDVSSQADDNWAHHVCALVISSAAEIWRQTLGCIFPVNGYRSRDSPLCDCRWQLWCSRGRSVIAHLFSFAYQIPWRHHAMAEQFHGKYSREKRSMLMSRFDATSCDTIKQYACLFV